MSETPADHSEFLASNPDAAQRFLDGYGVFDPNLPNTIPLAFVPGYGVLVGADIEKARQQALEVKNLLAELPASTVIHASGLSSLGLMRSLDEQTLLTAEEVGRRMDDVLLALANLEEGLIAAANDHERADGEAEETFQLLAQVVGDAAAVAPGIRERRDLDGPGDGWEDEHTDDERRKDF